MKFNYQVVKYSNEKYGARFFQINFKSFGWNYLGKSVSGFAFYYDRLPSTGMFGSTDGLFFDTQEEAKEIIELFKTQNKRTLFIKSIVK